MFGDSIPAGVGARRRPYPVLVADALDAELVDLSASARQVGGSLRCWHRAADCDLAIVAHGATEALLRPPDASLHLLPRRWRRPGWLDPRPYFSSRRGRRLLQRTESAIRWRIKVVLMRIFGGIQWTRDWEFEIALAQLVESLGSNPILILGMLPIDERYFPGSSVEIRRYSEIGRRVAVTTGSTFVDLEGACRKWADFCADHFHPNPGGHRRIAERILAALESTELANRPWGGRRGAIQPFSDARTARRHAM